MNRRTLVLDAGAAALAAVLLIVISPGLAVVGLVAFVGALACTVSYALDRRRPRRRTRRR